jgi:hypothetical protein
MFCFTKNFIHSSCFQPKRMVWETVEKPKTKTAENFGDRARAENEREFNTGLNALVPFSADMNQVFENLAAEASKKNNAITAESLRGNLKDSLGAGKTMEILWKHLEDNHCQTAAITNGQLNFFAGPRGVNEISISPFLKPLEMKIGTGVYTSEYLRERDKTTEATRDALSALKNELPELPPKNIS